MVITGHTDESGTGLFNKRLSYERASSVGRYLTIHDVTSSAAHIDSKGEEDAFPLINGLSPEDREDIQNNERRVDIFISH